MKTPAATPIAIALPATGEEEWMALREPLLSGWLTQGPQVAAFERAFAARHRVQHAHAVSSCTTGLHLALVAAGIGPGDEVIVPAFTWVSTANAVVYVGATPVFADVSVETCNVDLEDVKRRITPKTKAVIAVHLFGLCVDVPALRHALPSGVIIVEDCACAAGAALNGVPAGGLGDIGVFSFHPRKSITTGEGGMVTTNTSALAEAVDRLRNHGASVSEEQRHGGPQPYLLPDFDVLGFNYRMTDLQGAVGLVQLRKLDAFIEERQRWAEYYRRELADLPWLHLPQFPTSGNHAWQAFVTYVDPALAPMPRNAMMARLQQEGISTRPGTHAVHTLGYYRTRYGLPPDAFPGALACHDGTMAVPLHNRMDPSGYARVVDALHAI